MRGIIGGVIGWRRQGFDTGVAAGEEFPKKVGCAYALTEWPHTVIDIFELRIQSGDRRRHVIENVNVMHQTHVLIQLFYFLRSLLNTSF